MKICIAGKNDIAVNILEYLILKGVDKSNIFVCCNRTETGLNSWQKSLRFFAKKYNIREIELIEAYEIENLIFISLEFDRIVRPEKFKTKKLFNIHFSLLPKYKGMYTSALPILNNESITGCTFHRIDSGIDTGEIIAQRSIIIDFEDTSRDIYSKYISNGTTLVKDVIDKYLEKDFECDSYPQNAYESSYFSKKTIDYSNLTINLNTTALSIHNQIRAFNFREYQLPCVFGKKIRCTDILNIRSTEKPGTILWMSDSVICISTIDYDTVLYVDMFDKVIEYCKNNDIENLKKIENISYYVNERTENGWTPLIIATYNGFYDIAMYLISKGADIKQVNNNGTNLLMYSKEAYCKTGNKKLFEFYLSKGLDPYKSDWRGLNLIDYCKRQKITSIGSFVIN